MAKITMNGLAEYTKQLAALGANVDGMVKAAVYEGADEVADAVREAVKALPEVKTSEAVANWRQQVPVDGITKAQKDGLLDGLYLSKMAVETDSIYTQLGFDGYNRVKTKTYPKGQANSMIARAVESGSSARRKTPFVRPAVNRVKERAIQRMAEKLDQTIKNLMEE